MQDSIQRTVTINAPIERVYQAVLDDFFKAYKGELAPDQRGVFDFGEWGRSTIHIINVDPPRHVSYRWVPGTIFEGDIYEKGCTLVEFHLMEDNLKTTLTLTESGFSNLPSDRYKEAMENNSAGWDEEVTNFVKLFEE